MVLLLWLYITGRRPGRCRVNSDIEHASSMGKDEGEKAPGHWRASPARRPPVLAHGAGRRPAGRVPLALARRGRDGAGRPLSWQGGPDLAPGVTLARPAGLRGLGQARGTPPAHPRNAAGGDGYVDGERRVFHPEARAQCRRLTGVEDPRSLWMRPLYRPSTGRPAVALVDPHLGLAVDSGVDLLRGDDGRPAPKCACYGFSTSSAAQPGLAIYIRLGLPPGVARSAMDAASHLHWMTARMSGSSSSAAGPGWRAPSEVRGGRRRERLSAASICASRLGRPVPREDNRLR